MENFGLLKLLFSALSGADPSCSQSPPCAPEREQDQQNPTPAPSPASSPLPTVSNAPSDSPAPSPLPEHDPTTALFALFKDHDERARRIEQTHKKPPAR